MERNEASSAADGLDRQEEDDNEALVRAFLIADVRGLPFARFRAKLVAVLLGMTLIPSILVLIVGSELIRNSADRWFNAPMDEVLSSANRIASDYYAERQRFVVDQAGRIAKGLTSLELTSANVAELQTRIAPEVAPGRLKMVEVFRLAPEAGVPSDVAPVLDVASPTLPPGASQASAERLASRVAAGATETTLSSAASRMRNSATPLANFTP